ncbi:hypothetical protein FRZ67_05595 [Panacibacter ginsenosidivorans]|uniref:Uncharacterized protein n=1 Tax=Panacibacter ginsenosidivorans TaxID=1813871 RepID=A0A5B8V5W4_9BACT|nr:hypothetical protein FRZ67_05595 [Panacibacter ginsenosidivorans]
MVYCISDCLPQCLWNSGPIYITAVLAPAKPMRHAMIGGFIGFVLSIVGAIVILDKAPHWYAISLIILALPSAWLGG